MKPIQKIIVVLSSSMFVLPSHAQTSPEATPEPKSSRAPSPIKKVEQSVACGGAGDEQIGRHVCFGGLVR